METIKLGPSRTVRPAAAASPMRPRAPASGGSPVLRLLRVWLFRWRSRRDLALMDRRMLRDIGIDAVAAAEEARRPFWSGGQ